MYKNRFWNLVLLFLTKRNMNASLQRLLRNLARSHCSYILTCGNYLKKKPTKVIFWYVYYIKENGFIYHLGLDLSATE